jgi:nucleotide-binding universal stress UspA family protein
MLAETRDALAPRARTVVQPDHLVWRALRHVVRAERRDLLVVGSGHAGHEGRVRLGKDAGDLGARLECPLAIAPSAFGNYGKRTLGRIGVGFDGGPESQAALRMAASIARAAHAELEVRGAVDDSAPSRRGSEQIVLDGEAIIVEQAESSEESDPRAGQDTAVSARVRVGLGMSTDILLELCERVDILVIGSGRVGPSGRLVLGSTAKALLQWAPCPLVVVPRPVSRSEA